MNRSGKIRLQTSVGARNATGLCSAAGQREAGKARLDRDLLGFYYYRRLFEDLVDFILRLQSGVGDAQQRDQDDLLGVRECLEDLPQVEATLEAIRQHKG